MTIEEIEQRLRDCKDMPFIMPLVTRELGGAVRMVDNFICNKTIRENLYDLMGITLTTGEIATEVGQLFGCLPLHIARPVKIESQDPYATAREKASSTETV